MSKMKALGRPLSRSATSFFASMRNLIDAALKGLHQVHDFRLVVFLWCHNLSALYLCLDKELHPLPVAVFVVREVEFSLGPTADKGLRQLHFPEHPLRLTLRQLHTAWWTNFCFVIQHGHVEDTAHW